MKKTTIYLLILSLLFTSCGSSNNEYQTKPNPNSSVNVSVKEAEPSISDGLKLKDVGQLISVCKTPEELQNKLNEKNGINNLDLNKDGNIDYIRVTEQNEGNSRKYILSTKNDSDEDTEIANITLTPNEKLDQVDMSISGNERIYPQEHHHHYHSSISATDILLMAWILTPRTTYYVSPYHPPVYYQPTRVVPYNEHNVNRITITKKSKITYTNVNKTPSSKVISSTTNTPIKTPPKSINQPKVDDNKYKTVDKSKALNSNGFTNKTKPNSEVKKENTSFTSVEKKPLKINSFSSSNKDNSTKSSKTSSNNTSKGSSWSSSGSRSSGSSSSKGSSWSSGGSRNSGYSSGSRSSRR